MPHAPAPHDHGQPIEHAPERIPSVDEFQTVSELFRQLGDECVINLSSLVQMSSPAVSHHLRQLKAAGLIVSRREGKEVYYRSADTPQAQLLHRMIEELVEITCPLL